jgi:transcriptional regulator with XRE-family HTH domain
MSLRDILSRAFSGKQPPRGTLGSLIAEAKRLAGGSRRAAARAIGMAESTLRTWEKGKNPRGGRAAAAERVAGGVRKLSVRQDAPPDRVTATIANPGRGPATRTVRVDPGGVERARTAWAAGDDVGAVREFRAAIEDDWYREQLFAETPDPDDGSDPVLGGVSW